jgi:hypothetical protein
MSSAASEPSRGQSSTGLGILVAALIVVSFVVPIAFLVAVPLLIGIGWWVRRTPGIDPVSRMIATVGLVAGIGLLVVAVLFVLGAMPMTFSTQTQSSPQPVFTPPPS